MAVRFSICFLLRIIPRILFYVSKSPLLSSFAIIVMIIVYLTQWFGAFYNLLPQTRSTLICVPLVFALNALHTWNRMVCLQFHFQTYQIL